MGKDKPLVHIPFGVIKPLAQLLGGFSFFPVTTDQLVMLQEENILKDRSKEQEFKTLFPQEQPTLAEGLQTYFTKKNR